MLWLPLAAVIAIVLTAVQVQLREEHPAWAVVTALAFLVTVTLALLPRMESIITVFGEMARTANVSSIYLTPVLKAIAVAYITSFGVVLSREAGEDSIASTIELAGKVVILIVAVPLVQAIFSALLGLLDY
ncbi:MAG: SpoIIIAC/SpoIIIAD family protein [Limnochordia bacterium]|jgi:stage III sporulation protein AD